MAEKKTKASFEENLKELESVVKALEGQEVTLDEMLSLFEKGIGLTKDCTAQLDGAEQKINILMKNEDGEMISRPFEAK